MQQMMFVSLWAQIFVTGETGMSPQLTSYIELYWYPWLSVSPGNLLCCRRYQYNLLYINLSLSQKSAHTTCDVTDQFIIIVTSMYHVSRAKGYQALPLVTFRRFRAGESLEMRLVPNNTEVQNHQFNLLCHNMSAICCIQPWIIWHRASTPHTHDSTF